MTSPWGSPFKDLGSFVGAVSKTLQTAEKAIDKAIGIPPEDAAQNGKKETNTVNVVNESVPDPESIRQSQTASTKEAVSLPVAHTTENSWEWKEDDWKSSKMVPTKSTSIKSPALGRSSEFLVKSPSSDKLTTLPTAPTQQSQQGSPSSPVHQQDVIPVHHTTVVYSEPLPVTSTSRATPIVELDNQTTIHATNNYPVAQQSDNPTNHTNPTNPLSPAEETPSQQEHTENGVISPSVDHPVPTEEQPVESSPTIDTLPTTDIPPVPQPESEDPKETEKLNTSSDPEPVIESPSGHPESAMASDTESEATTNTVHEEWERKLHLVNEILKDRERQLQVIIRDNASIREENEQLKSKVQEMSVFHSSDVTMDSLKVEFSKRLGELERKLATMKKERDELKRNSQSAAVTTGIPSSDALAEKDTEITTLRMEGEKLSKQILKLESTVKSLRASKKEDDKSISSLKERLQNTENLLEAKVTKLKELEEESKKYSDTVSTMKDLSDSAAKQLDERKRQEENAQRQAKEYQEALEKAWVELAEQKKLNAAGAVKSAALLKETEARVREEYQQLLLRQAKEAAEREASLSQTIQELRNTVSKSNEHANWKEEEHNSEIQSLKARLQAAEARNEELASAVPEATRPLLRQIEALQASNAEKAKIWEEIERTLTLRINDADLQAQQSIEREREALDKYNETLLKLKSLESEQAAQRNTHSRIMAELEFERNKNEEKQKEIERLQIQYTTLTLVHDKFVQEARQTEGRLQRALEEAQERENMYNREKQDLEERTRKILQEERPNVQPVRATSQSKIEIMQTLASNVQSSLPIEKLQSVIRQKEGEVLAMQEQISSLEKTRALLQDEIVNLTSKNESLMLELEEMNTVRSQMKEMTQRYNTALQLIGEKEEQLEELRADIQDVKSLYKSQISDLLEKIEQLSKSQRKS